MATINNAPRRVRGRDVSAPIDAITLAGERYPLKFNNRAARIAEDVYSEVYAREGLPGREGTGAALGYADILNELAEGRWRAIQAVLYAAMVAGGTPMPWDEFDGKYRLDAIDGVRELVQRGVAQSLPEPVNEAPSANP